MCLYSECSIDVFVSLSFCRCVWIPTVLLTCLCADPYIFMCPLCSLHVFVFWPQQSDQNIHTSADRLEHNQKHIQLNEQDTHKHINRSHKFQQNGYGASTSIGGQVISVFVPCSCYRSKICFEWYLLWSSYIKHLYLHKYILLFSCFGICDVVNTFMT
jgi:hypothetical protein